MLERFARRSSKVTFEFGAGAFGVRWQSEAATPLSGMTKAAGFYSGV
jgi:hypothetical protein